MTLPLPFESPCERERKLLAEYAFFSDQSRGRRFPEAEHPYRGPFQRDRDRIVHSAAFRRLSGKMQVFTGDMGDYHRTRLTHTMEVASVARTIGRALRLNEDLIEALALLHDIGHPPFGHAGEDALRDCLADQGGFSHNQFALTLVEDLEQRYPHFPGLNLSLEVLDGQRARADKQAGAKQPLLEVQVVEAADGIAYNAHDVDDGLKLELVTPEELRGVPLVDGLVSDLLKANPAMPWRMFRQMIVRKLLDVQISSLIEATRKALAPWPPPSDAARDGGLRIDMHPEIAHARGELAQFLYDRIYRHEKLMTIRGKAQGQIRWLFDFFARHTEELPPFFRDRAELVGPARAAGDYLAGMTDRFCREQYQRYARDSST